MKKLIFICCLLMSGTIIINAHEILAAIGKGDLPEVKKLVERDPQLVNSRFHNGYTPLLFAADNNKKEVAEYLLSKGAYIDDVFMPYYGYTPITYGIMNGNIEMIKMLLKRGANIQYRTNLGENYLHFAAAHDRVDIAKYLIDCGIDINSVKNGGLTPMHIAAVFGRLDIAKLLVNKGANLNLKSKDGGTPLHFAAAARNDKLADFLRHKGAKDIPREFPEYKGKYLGQKKPGKIPKAFIPEIFLDIYRTYSAPAFSPDHKEVFWTGYIMPGIRVTRIWWMREKDGKWTPPEVAPFSDYRSNSPAYSFDGKKLFFAAWRPLNGKTTTDSDLWVVEKQRGKWSEPRHLGSPPNKKGIHENNPLPAKDGTIYFSAFGSGTKGAEICKAKFINGKYSECQSLNGLFVSDIADDCMDMDYIIFHTPYRKRTYGTELFICFHKPDGIWTRPLYLGDKFHKGHASNFGKMSPDGKYFFFLQDISLYWVDASFIEDLRKEVQVQNNKPNKLRKEK